MRILITVLFLVSFGSGGMAEEGDVYYCVTENFVSVDEADGLTIYEQLRFKFKIKFSDIFMCTEMTRI